MKKRMPGTLHSVMESPRLNERISRTMHLIPHRMMEHQLSLRW